MAYVPAKSLFKSDNTPLETNNVKMYQVQASKDSNTVHVIHVGNTSVLSEVLINKFDLDENTSCVITSCVHDIVSDQMDMIRLYIYKKNELVGHISMTFNGKDVKPSTIDDKIPNIGCFKYVYHFKNKCVVLHEIDKFPGNNMMINNMIEQLLQAETFINDNV